MQPTTGSPFPCHTSFTVPYDNSEISHDKMTCQEAFNFIEQNFFPYRYFNHVKITARPGILSQEKRYRALSRSQFVCLLDCGQTGQSSLEYRKCRDVCLEMFEYVAVNNLDRIRLAEHLNKTGQPLFSNKSG